MCCFLIWKIVSQVKSVTFFRVEEKIINSSLLLFYASILYGFEVLKPKLDIYRYLFLVILMQIECVILLWTCFKFFFSISVYVRLTAICKTVCYTFYLLLRKKYFARPVNFTFKKLCFFSSKLKIIPDINSILCTLNKKVTYH